MSKMGLNDPFGYLKHKLWPKKGLGVKLTKIALIPLLLGGISHTIGKLLTRATTLL
jgi:hypothetical protein